MDRICIRGGQRLHGELPISGAKNAALPLMAAALLSEEPLTLANVPDLADIVSMADLLRRLGVSVVWRKGERVGEGGVVTISATGPLESIAPYDIVRKMRASFLVMGPLLARTGTARVSLPGGCAIGARPVDLHLKGFAALGAEIALSDGYVIATCREGLKGADFTFPSVTVGGTENLLMAAVLAKGRTVLANVAREPEIVDLGECLIAMGAHIAGLGSDRLVIEGVPALGRTRHAVLPDRIESGTYAVAAALAGGELELVGTRADLLGAVLTLLTQAGSEITITNRGFKVARNGRHPMPVDLTTAPYPGFPTDVQAQFMALMTIADGVSHIRETIFENRFMHVPELVRMGADIGVEGDTATVHGPARLKGAPVMATDLRASVSLVLAGLAAEGETVVNRVYHLDRGFEHIEQKFGACGADVVRLTGEG